MKYDVVIIDTGVNRDHPKIKGYSVDAISMSRSSSGEYVIRDLPQNGDDVGHGTAMTSIILSHSPKAHILMVKIFDQALIIDEELLLAALEYVLHNIDCAVLNLSLGISSLENYSTMYDVCRMITNKGCCIVSAFDNDGAISFPAAFDNVVGVTHDNGCRRPDDYVIIKNSIVNIGANGGIQRIPWLNGEYAIGSGNSYACAHISGLLANKKIKITDIIDVSGFGCDIIRKPTSFASMRAVLFPFNKEMHALIRFQDLLDFKIVGVYDHKYSPSVGASVNALLQLELKSNHIVERIENIHWADFDMIIIGHTSDLSSVVRGYEEIFCHLLERAQLEKKCVFSFDAIPDKYKNTPNFFCPNSYTNYSPIPYGKLYKQPKPVIAVFGTSSKQGKFSLQLSLRKKLMDKGYVVGQLGTEPSSELFGMDACFHFGYDSTLNITRFAAVSLVNNLLYEISKKGVDLIITGCQADTVLEGEGNLFNYPLPQVEFLFGALPDAVILTVNPDDNIDLIKRSILFLESCADCKVIAIAVFPLCTDKTNMFAKKTLLNKLDFDYLSNVIREECGVSSFVIGNDKHMCELANLIENFFGG